MEDKKRILVVDDEEIMRDVLYEIISDRFQERVIIETADNFKDAQQKLNQKQYDLLISDVELGDGSGLNLDCSCSRIFCSSDISYTIKAIQQGAFCFLKKPFKDINQITEAIKIVFNWK